MIEDSIFCLPKKLDFNATHKKALFVLDNTDQQTHITETLHAIIKAIKLDIESDVDLLYIDKTSKYEAASVLNKYQNIIVFGINPAHLGIQTTIQRPGLYAFEKFTFIMTFAMATLVNDKEKKLHLWNILQKTFLENK